MKKQYLPQFKWKGYDTDTWNNAHFHATGKRYANTLEEALQSLKKVIEENNNKGARIEHQNAAGLGVSMFIDEETADKFQVAETRIKVREITEWEVIDVE